MPVQSSPVQSSPVQSVIIPTYNRKDFIVDAINSVLKQKDIDLELIIADDCSTDGTADFVKSIQDERIRYFRNDKNSGLEYNRNFGLKHARGKYITWLDDDDYYTDYEFFSKAVKILEEHEADEVPVVMVCANAKMMNMQTNQARDSDIGSPGRVKGLDYILGKGHRKPLSTFPAVFRADILRKAGLEEKIIFDTATYLEVALEGDAWFMSDVIGVYRVHAQNMTAGGFRSKNSEREARHYEIASENMKRWKHVAEVLPTRTDKKTADRLYIHSVLGLAGYYANARPQLKDRIKTYMCILKVSGFMPKLWIAMLLSFPRSQLRKITPLRKLYRFFKYRLRGKPYPSNF